jgi:hypothetical protein
VIVNVRVFNTNIFVAGNSAAHTHIASRTQEILKSYHSYVSLCRHLTSESYDMSSSWILPGHSDSMEQAPAIVAQVLKAGKI